MKNKNNNDELKSLPIRLSHDSETSPLRFHTTVKLAKDNQICIVASATDMSDGSIFGRHQRTIMDLNHWQQVAKSLETRIEYEFNAKHTNRSESLARDSTVFDAALQETLAGRGRINYVWAESTEKIAIQDYNRLCKYLVDYLPVDEFSVDVHKYVEQAFGERVRQHGNSSGNQDTMDNSAQTALRYGVEVYQVVREFWNEHHPENKLPEIDWQIRSNNRIPNAEQFKMLSSEIRQNFCALLKSHAKTQPALVKSAVLMMLGSRTAEAAAVTAQQITFYADHSIVSVIQQSKGTMAMKRLKTKNSYRILPAPKWHTELLRICFSALAQSSQNGLIPAEQLSAWVYDQLVQCGCTKDFLEQARKKMHGDLHADSISAYVLRRDFASLATTIMGFTKNETRYYLGHKQRYAKKNMVDYRLPENAQLLLDKLERYVYDKTLSMNPAFHPRKALHGEDFTLPEYCEVKIEQPDYATHHTITAVAREPGEPIVIHLPAGTKIDICDCTIISKKFDPTISKPVIGNNKEIKNAK